MRLDAGESWPGLYCAFERIVSWSCDEDEVDKSAIIMRKSLIPYDSSTLLGTLKFHAPVARSAIFRNCVRAVYYLLIASYMPMYGARIQCVSFV